MDNPQAFQSGESMGNEHCGMKYVRQVEEQVGQLFPYTAGVLVKRFVRDYLQWIIFQCWEQAASHNRCTHANIEFHAATCADDCHDGGNITHGVTAFCPDCRGSWAGDVRVGFRTVDAEAMLAERERRMKEASDGTKS